MTDVEMARQAVGRWKAMAEALARDIWSYAELPYCETKIRRSALRGPGAGGIFR